MGDDVKTKADMPINLLGEEEGTDFARVFFELSHLKQLYRQGWLRVGVPEQRCESVADHSYFTVHATCGGTARSGRLSSAATHCNA